MFISFNVLYYLFFSIKLLIIQPKINRKLLFCKHDRLGKSEIVHIFEKFYAFKLQIWYYAQKFLEIIVKKIISIKRSST